MHKFNVTGLCPSVEKVYCTDNKNVSRKFINDEIDKVKATLSKLAVISKRASFNFCPHRYQSSPKYKRRNTQEELIRLINK